MKKKKPEPVKNQKRINAFFTVKSKDAVTKDSTSKENVENPQSSSKNISLISSDEDDSRIIPKKRPRKSGDTPPRKLKRPFVENALKANKAITEINRY
jgi:hypothetical protein